MVAGPASRSPRRNLADAAFHLRNAERSLEAVARQTRSSALLERVGEIQRVTKRCRDATARLRDKVAEAERV